MKPKPYHYVLLVAGLMFLLMGCARKPPEKIAKWHCLALAK